MPAGSQAHAETLTLEALSELVRDQAAEIAELKRQVSELKGASSPAQDDEAVAIQPTAAEGADAPPEPPEPPERFDSVEWGHGAPVFRSPDGRFSFKPRGRIMLDATKTVGSDHSDRTIATTGARALRLGVEGTAGRRFFYQFETDFSDNEVDIVTAFMGWESRIAGLDYDIRVGNLFNDRGFDASTGSSTTSFLERNVVGTAIVPERGFYGVGAQLRLFGPSWHASLAFTGEDIDDDHSAGDGRTTLARVHWNPVKTDGVIVHLGAWGFREDFSSPATTISRNTVIGGRFNDNLRVPSGEIDGVTDDLGYGVEAGAFIGPFWAMGEAGERRFDLMSSPDVAATAWSLSAGWFVMGAVPAYNPRLGNLGFVDVRSPFTDGGRGALEITARYESLDYTHAPEGGDGRAATVGVNWYFNDLMRVMLNGIYWRTENSIGEYVGPDDGFTLTGRAQVSF